MMDRLFQGTNPPERSPTWTKVKVICERCKKEFETPKRSDMPIEQLQKICQECEIIERYATRVKESKEKLPAIRKEVQETWGEQCGLPAKFQDKTFGGFNQKLQPKAYQVMREYDGETSVILSSDSLYGVGKTHLIAAIINKMIDGVSGAHIDKYGEVHKHSCNILFTTENQMLARIRATYNKQDDDSPRQETERDVLKKLTTVSHLFIDDVGKVRPRDYSFLQGVYFQVIDGRYCNEYPIVLTTNLSLVELEKHIGGACADRLREMCGKNIIKMSGKSQRIKD